MDGDRWKGMNVISWQALQHHVYCIGQSGCGKSTLIRNAIIQLQEASREGVFPCSVWFVDPKADDSLKLLAELDTLADVTFLDPQAGFSINPFELPPHQPNERPWVLSRYVSYIVSLFEEWYGSTLETAPRMFRILETLTRALYAKTDAPTWIDLHALVVTLQSGDEAKVKAVLRVFEDVLSSEQMVELKRAVESVAQLRAEAFDPVLNRIQKFALDEVLKRLFSVRRSSIDIMELLKPNHVAVVRVPQIGREAHALVMSSIVLKLWFAVQERAATLPEPERTPVILFLDEFQEIEALGVLDQLLAQARSFGLCLWLSHQNLAQISEKRLETILGNTATQICGAVSGVDAGKIARHWDPQFARQIEQTLATMPFYSFMVRERAFEGEQQPPVMRRAIPPPQQRRSQNEIDSFISDCKFRYGLGVSDVSLFDEALGKVPNWTRYLPEAELPSEAEWKLLCALYTAGKPLSYTQACEYAALPRSEEARGAWERLHTQGFTRIAGGGRTPYFTLTKKGQAFFTPDFTIIGRGEAVNIAKRAFNTYVRRGLFCSVAVQKLESERPDLVAYDYQQGFSIAVEAETLPEIKTHLEQVHHNMVKWRLLGFQACHVWYPKQGEERVRAIHERLPEEVKRHVQLNPV